MNEFEQDDFELEISDLPDTGNARQAPTFVRMLVARPRLRSLFWRAATVGCAVILIFLALNGNFSMLRQNLLSLFVHATPVATVQSSEVIISQGATFQSGAQNKVSWIAMAPPVVTAYGTLGQVPQSCEQYTTPQNFDSPAFPPGVGGSPMWVTGFAGPRAVLNQLVRARSPQYGWYQQLELVSESNYAGTVTLQGGIVGSGFPLGFGVFPHSEYLITSISVKPMDTSVSNHFGGDQQWGVLPIHVYIMEAGCYYLQATWDGGSWTVYFAAGR